MESRGAPDPPTDRQSPFFTSSQGAAMQKRDRKLDLHRETLTRLDKVISDKEIRVIFGGESTSHLRYCLTEP
jgi:hypothetical protein